MFLSLSYDYTNEKAEGHETMSNHLRKITMATIQNDLITLRVNDAGQIEHLSMKGGPNVIARPTGLFRAILKTGENWEDVVFADRQWLNVSVSGHSVLISCDKLRTRDGERGIALRLTIRLEGDRLVFESMVSNSSESTLNEWIYPCLGTIDTLSGGKPDLLYPKHLGEKIKNISEYLRGRTDRDATHEISHAYPCPLSMQWMLLEDSGTCLYLSGRDTLFYTSALRARGSKEGGVTLEMNKMAFVKPGETWECPAYLAWLYEGSWMQGAREYALWAASWRTPVTPRDWVKKMNGCFLVINRQQYGDENWPYDTLPALYDFAKAHGFDTLGLYGWYQNGHDGSRPGPKVSLSLGGEKTLKENIKKVQGKGGRVTLYFQGRLMDTGSDFYRETGRKIESKTRWGTPYYEYDDKYCHSDYLHYFSKKPFAAVCPSCEEWHELMARHADWVYSLGADAILYDHLGGMTPYPCFDESHPHLMDKPSLSHAQGRLRVHKKIREQAERSETCAYMTGNVTDAHSQFPDCLYCAGSFPGIKGTGTSLPVAGDAALGNTESPGPMIMPDLFRFTFPQTLITIRNPNPSVSRRLANFALLYGFKLEMELRNFTDKEFILDDEGNEDRLYSRQLARLRSAHGDYLLEGRFLAQESLSNGNEQVKAALFERADGCKAAVLWNDTDEDQPVSLSLEGARWNSWASPEEEGSGIPALIKPQGAMLIYEA